MQPHSHLPIAAFALDPTDLPKIKNSPPSTPRRSRTPSRIAPDYIIASAAQYLPKDTALLSTIAILEELRCESNMASFIRAGGLDKVRSKYTEIELVERGRDVLHSLNIKISRIWRDDWSLVSA